MNITKKTYLIFVNRFQFRFGLKKLEWVSSEQALQAKKGSGTVLLSDMLDATLGVFHTSHLALSNISKWVPLILDGKHI